MTINDLIQPGPAPAYRRHDPYAAHPIVLAPAATDLMPKPPRNEAEIVLRAPSAPQQEVFLGHVWWNANAPFLKWLLESVCHVSVFAMRIKLRKHHGRLIPSGTWYATILAVDVDRVERFTDKLRLCVAQVPPGGAPQIAVVPSQHAEEYATKFREQNGVQVNVLEPFVMERSRPAAPHPHSPPETTALEAAAVSAHSHHDGVPIPVQAV
jgi:hypothetical protein